jgi:AraC family transcriptional regulator
MRDLHPIHTALAFIESRLQEEVTVAEIAEAAGYSLYHFIRVFNQAVRHTPYDYLMRRRLSAAAQDLIASDRRVYDIALDYCFNNHETFSRAFKRFFGMQPVQWREHGIIPRRTLMPALSYEYLQHINAPKFQRPRRMVSPECRLVGLMSPLADQPQASTRLWQDLRQVAPACRQENGPQNYFGVTAFLDEQGERAYYLAACEQDAGQAACPRLASQRLPAGDILCIVHFAPLADLHLTLTYLYHTWLPKACLELAHPLEIIAFGSQPPWMEWPAQVEVWLPVRRKEAAGLG